jgi:N-acetyl-anhydromuramyl-L-alanine amidase AmpD
VPAKRSTSRRVKSHRTRLVWGTFIFATAIVTGALALVRQANPRPGFLLTSVEVLGQTSQNDPVFQIHRPLDRQRWNSIVIHHSGEPAGDAESITREHMAAGLKGLGYHFLIGNGNGLGNGVVHVGYRWIDQLPGAHVSGPQQDQYNEHSIAICLVGNGDRRPFTAAQMAQLVSLVQHLQAELHIPARNVYLHRDLSRATTSPGRYFETASLQEQLLDQ